MLSNCTGRSYSFNVPAALNYTQMTQMNKLAARPSLKPPKIPTVKKTVSIRGVRGKPKETESNVAVRQLIQAENNTSSDESHLGNGYLGELGAEEEISQGDSKSPNVRQPPPQQLPQQKFARLQIGTKNVIMVPVTMLKSK